MWFLLFAEPGWTFHAEKNKNNAIAQADTPFFDRIMKNNTWTLISGSGDDVGLTYDRNLALAGMIDDIRTEIVWKGSEGYFWEAASYNFADFVLYNDEAGCRLRSDT